MLELCNVTARWHIKYYVTSEVSYPQNLYYYSSEASNLHNFYYYSSEARVIIPVIVQVTWLRIEITTIMSLKAALFYYDYQKNTGLKFSKNLISR